MVSNEAHKLTKEWLRRGVSYASAQQKAADAIMGERSEVFGSPNNVLGIEYIKALKKYDSAMQPVTVQRTGGDHDSDGGYSASFLRKGLVGGNIPLELMTESAAAVCRKELEAGRGPVTVKQMELAFLSRLRALGDYSDVSGMSEGLEGRFMRYAMVESSVASILTKVKTKRYPMSRLRRILMCAALGINLEHVRTPPPYARVLAMNAVGMKLLSKARKEAKLPVIIKPASVYKFGEVATRLFELEAASTDFYVLAYPNVGERNGGQEWRQSPLVMG